MPSILCHDDPPPLSIGSGIKLGEAVAEQQVVVEVWRGDRVESRHRASAVALDRHGRIRHQIGDAGLIVYPRSSIKPIQSLHLILSGAADAYNLGQAELALACASHSAEARHVALVRSWLERIGLDDQALGCGPQRPSFRPAYEELIKSGREPRRWHNNCSGKHTGMLNVVRHLGFDEGAYLAPAHPLQERIKQTIAGLCGESLEFAPGIDGCGAPNWPISLLGLATAASRLALADGPTPDQGAALARMAAAMQAEPFLVAGSERCCTAIMQTVPGMLAKTGAEGVYLLGHQPTGTGIALKIEDGSTRAAQALAIAMMKLCGFLGDEAGAGLEKFANPVIKNFAGQEVGRIAMAPGWAES